MITTEHRDEGVVVVRFDADQNLLHRDSLSALLDALSAARDDPRTQVVVTTGTGRFYSTGLDLEGLRAGSEEDRAAASALLHRACYELLVFPVPTVAALNGHAFAGGALLALAHDLRVQRSDRGYFCLPEVLVDVPPTTGLTALARAKLVAPVAEDLLLSGRRIGAPEALRLGVVVDEAPEDELESRAIELGLARCGPSRATLTAIKQNLHADVLADLLKGGRLL